MWKFESLEITGNKDIKKEDNCENNTHDILEKLNRKS